MYQECPADGSILLINSSELKLWSKSKEAVDPVTTIRISNAVCGFVLSQEYGGYLTSLLVSGEESPVKCGAILSPITDFELYGNFCSSILE